MKTVQMTLNEDLLLAVDKLAKELKTSRSAFTRAALQKEIEHFRVRRMEEKHRAGYEKYPVSNNEFSVWENEQDWGDH